MIGRIISIVLLVVGIVLLLLRLIPITKLVDIPDSFMGAAVLIAGGTVGFVLAERSK